MIPKGLAKRKKDELPQITPASLAWLQDSFTKEQLNMSVSFPLQSTSLIQFEPMPFPNVAFETPIPFLKEIYQ